MRQVIDAFPCSQSLSSFLWEPLSSSNTSWETTGEGKKSNSGDDIGQAMKIGPSQDSSTFTKPPLHTRSKPKSSNFAKISKYKAMGSVGSLNSIEENDGDDCDDES